MSTETVQKIVDLLERGHTAINTLERLSSNKYVYLDLKKEMQDMADSIKTQAGLAEFSDPEARNKMLDKNKKDAERAGR